MSRGEILRHRPLRALLAAEVISTTGSQMTWLALPWFVLTTTHSPARIASVMGGAPGGTDGRRRHNWAALGSAAAADGGAPDDAGRGLRSRAAHDARAGAALDRA